MDAGLFIGETIKIPDFAFLTKEADWCVDSVFLLICDRQPENIFEISLGRRRTSIQKRRFLVCGVFSEICVLHRTWYGGIYFDHILKNIGLLRDNGQQNEIDRQFLGIGTPFIGWDDLKFWIKCKFSPRNQCKNNETKRFSNKFWVENEKKANLDEGNKTKM